MRILQSMRSARISRRWSREARAEAAFERASVQLHVLVALAAADDEILDSERAHLTDIADRLSNSLTRDRIHALLQQLLETPPSEEDALRALIAAPGSKGLSHSLIDDITAIARADAHVHVREERLVSLLSAVGGGRPMSLRHRFGVPLHQADQELLDRITAEVEAERAAKRDAA